MNSIFLQIAAYHDYELPKTIANAALQSSGKNKIHFGIHNCYREIKHIHIPNVNKIDHIKLNIIESQAPNNIGVGLSRTIANNFYDGEDYYLQVDSHTRFVKDWDIGFINSLRHYQACGVDKPLLTSYPAGYYYDDNLVEKFNTNYSLTNISFHQKLDFSDNMVPHQTGVPVTNNLSKSVSGGCIFSIGDFHKIAINKKMYNWGEEILVAARAFTHGYDLLLPDKQYLFHLYYDASKSFQHNLRRHAWTDWPVEHGEFVTGSNAEIKNIFSNQIIGEQALGSVRTLDEFGEFAGLDFRTGKVIQTD
jgi:hypothetical protein